MISFKTQFKQFLCKNKISNNHNDHNIVHLLQDKKKLNENRILKNMFDIKKN